MFLQIINSNYLLPPRLPPPDDPPELRLPPPEDPPELRLGDEKLPDDLEGEEVLLLGAE